VIAAAAGIVGSKSWRALPDAEARLTAFPWLFANGMLRVVFLPPATGGPLAGRPLPRPRPLLALLVLVCVLLGAAVVPAAAAPAGVQSGRVRILRDEYGGPTC